MPTYSDNNEFVRDVVEAGTSNALDNALEWIKNRLSPEEVFSDYELSGWAYENGFIKEDYR